MGKIKERHLKVAAEKLYTKNPEHYTASFEENKAKINEFNVVKGGKHDRNRLAGCLTVTRKRELKIKTQKEAVQQAQANQAAMQAQARQTA